MPIDTEDSPVVDLPDQTEIEPNDQVVVDVPITKGDVIVESIERPELRRSSRTVKPPDRLDL